MDSNTLAVTSARRSSSRGWRFNAARLAAAIGLAGALLAPAAQAAQRVLDLVAPTQAAANARVEVTVRASTDAGAGEQIGFLHAEYSVDGGKTWTGVCYEQNLGAAQKRQFGFETGAAGTKALFRVRVAFRGGVAGDVDFKGAAIKWEGSWNKWDSPPARTAELEITGR